MSRRSRVPEPLGVFPDEFDFTSTVMRTAALMALDEIPDELLKRILGRRPKSNWMDYDEARHLIAEHLVVRIRAQVHCEYRSGPAIAR